MPDVAAHPASMAQLSDTVLELLTLMRPEHVSPSRIGWMIPVTYKER
jgi:hypothetical protein